MAEKIELLRKKYENQIVDDDGFDSIYDCEYVERVENNGNSGLHSHCVWWTAYFKDGTEMDFYTT